MKTLKDVLRKGMLLYKRLLYFIAKVLVCVDEKTVFFEAFQGRSVACSPKALYLEMLKNPIYREYQLIWSLRKTNREDLKENRNTEIVKFESFAYYKALAKAKYWIFNSNTRPFLKPRKNQIFVQTWHGTPLKKIGCDVMRAGNAMTKLSDIQKIYEGEAKKISYMISPSAYCTEKLISAFHLQVVGKENAVLTTGYPRNDFLYQATEQDIGDIKKQIGIPTDKKVILYAPTFRDNQYSAKKGFCINSHIDFKKAKEVLGEDYVILFRAHYFIAERMDFSGLQGFVYDVSGIEDINELYVVSDLLVTDYSSVFFDYANLKRPIIFFMKDYEEYKNELRDFYLEPEELPGPVVREQEHLFEQIKNSMEHFEYDRKYQQFHDKFNYLDGADTAGSVLQKIIK